MEGGEWGRAQLPRMEAPMCFCVLDEVRIRVVEEEEESGKERKEEEGGRTRGRWEEEDTFT